LNILIQTALSINHRSSVSIGLGPEESKVDEIETANAFQAAREAATAIAYSLRRRRGIRVRSAFVRDRTGQRSAPMGKLIAAGGRCGGIALKVYLALLWLRPVVPTEISPGKLATLIGLGDPAKNGPRRVGEALRILAEYGLITAERRRGGPPRVALLREDGRGGRYFAPRGDDDDYYFYLPTALWTSGELQKLTTPGLALLLAIMAEQRSPGAAQWWSTKAFADRIGLSPATRTRGTRELQKAGLISAGRRRDPRPGSIRADPMRNVYVLTGTAVWNEQNVRGDGRKSARANTPEELMAQLKSLLAKVERGEL
jgi:DNA-binding transcriptional ArsR family regulator